MWRFATPVLSATILIVVLFQLRNLDFAEVRALIPTSPLFWIIFAFYYLSSVIADFAIFRRLWGIPAEGFVALLRKLVSNELLFGYVGEVYFYSWARKKMVMTTSPFGAVKDAAILSALVGNLCTLAMMAAALPYLDKIQLNISTNTLILSACVLALIPTLAIIFGKKLFSLTKAQLWEVSGIHFLRVIATTGLTALLWSIALPKVALSWWVVLSAVRLLISRLPLVTNKDLLFAGVAVVVVGHNEEISALMAVWAAIILSTHIVVGAVLAIGDFVTVEKKR